MMKMNAAKEIHCYISHRLLSKLPNCQGKNGCEAKASETYEFAVGEKTCGIDGFDASSDTKIVELWSCGLYESPRIPYNNLAMAVWWDVIA